MKELAAALWARTPIRVRAVLGSLLLLVSLLGLWAAAGWALPTRELALRALETQNAFGPGEIVAQGDITFRWNLPARNAPDAWLVSRSGDSFLVVVLDHRPWPLWQGSDFGLPRPSWALSPTEEDPLVYTYLANHLTNHPEQISPGPEDMEYLLAVCAADEDIVSVEVSMNCHYRLEDGSGGYTEERRTAPVTAAAEPAGPGVWTARLYLADPLTGGGSWGVNVRLRGYGADGNLLCDSGVY